MAREQKNERVTKKAERAPKEEDGMVESVVKSRAFKDFMSTAAREIARGMFKSGRRSTARTLTWSGRARPAARSGCRRRG